MANRPVYYAIDRKPYFIATHTEFEYFSGFSKAQKQRCIASLHQSFLSERPNKKILEISSKSPLDLGVALSAFNLKISHADQEFTVETAYQSSKVFQKGGPFTDLLAVTSREAKKDPRLQNSGKLIGFRYFDKEFPLQPTNFFYNWLYINALHQNPELASGLLEYDAFTDIEFNPNRSANCQAKAAAVYVGLSQAGLLEKALESPESFFEVLTDSRCP